jgi:hypothetical protein
MLARWYLETVAGQAHHFSVIVSVNGSGAGP